MLQHDQHTIRLICAAAAFSVASLSNISVADDAPLHRLIDQQIEAGFAQWKVKAAEQSSDAEFVRRIYLDLTGVIPTAAATGSFLADKATDKRAKLVDNLLVSEEYAQHMATVFDVMLMERRPDKYVTTDEWRGYLKESFAANKPLNVLVSEILGSDGVVDTLRPASKFYLDRAVEKDLLVRDIGRLLLGVDMQCAQCHDHPSIDDYLHRHYHGLSVFVAGSKTFRMPDGTTVLQEMVTREVEFASVFEPEKTNKTGPRIIEALMELPELVEGEEYIEKPSGKVRAVPKFSLRKLLAERLPSDETPEFARNMVNRLWAMMMGRGLVHPLDMHHAENPPSHPDLLDLLAKRFSESKYDTKQFIREMALSKTYNRSSLIPADLDPEQVPIESFAVGNMKGLSPEQLFHSLLRATNSEKLFDQQIEEALKEDEAVYNELAADHDKLAQARAAKKAERVKEFVSLFGSAIGRPDDDFQASLPQALFIANGLTVVSWIDPGAENLTERLIAMDDSSMLAEEAYLNLMSRKPTAEELKEVTAHLANHKDDRRTAVMELVWSLVASAEFRLNH